MVESKPIVVQNPIVEAEAQVKIEVETKTEPEVEVEAEDEADAKPKAEAQAEAIAEEADELMCFDKSLQVSTQSSIHII